MYNECVYIVQYDFTAYDEDFTCYGAGGDEQIVKNAIEEAKGKNSMHVNRVDRTTNYVSYLFGEAEQSRQVIASTPLFCSQ